MTMEHVGEMRSVTKELGQGASKVVAVNNVSITINASELTLLMGPSGSGKTTLVSILGCILKPTTGHVIIDGRDTTGMSAEELAALRRRHIGFIFQSYNLFPTLNALENVRLALDVRGLRGRETRKRAEDALCSVGLADRMGNFPRQLSGGEQQRVAVARALAGAPSLILADEPTAALDSENGLAVMELLADIAHHEERAVLAVTHDPRTLSYADRILQIEDGKICGDARGRGEPTPSDLQELSERRKTVNA
ncbi:MAG: ABC transporter ATP-binding protein [Hyphomicrobiaceae bacterium]